MELSPLPISQTHDQVMNVNTLSKHMTLFKKKNLIKKNTSLHCQVFTPRIFTLILEYNK